MPKIHFICYCYLVKRQRDSGAPHRPNFYFLVCWFSTCLGVKCFRKAFGWTEVFFKNVLKKLLVCIPYHRSDWQSLQLAEPHSEGNSCSRTKYELVIFPLFCTLKSHEEIPEFLVTFFPRIKVGEISWHGIIILKKNSSYSCIQMFCKHSRKDTHELMF